MIVYHFISSEFALKALRDRRLKIARINELNDPVLFVFARVIALWSYYADDHRGTTLVSETPDN